MKTINSNLIIEVRNNLLLELGINSIYELMYYNHIEFTDDLFLALDRNEEVDSSMLSVVCLHSICKTLNKNEVIEDDFDEELVLIRNNNKLPLGLTFDQFNAIDFGYYTWIEYGTFNEDIGLMDCMYYDCYSVKGEKNLFDLKFFKNTFKILEKYLNNKGLIKDSNITTDSIDVISEFNSWFTDECKKHNDFVITINNILDV